MKKSLMMLGAAAMVLASCTQNEVMEVAENRAIQFNPFVGNVTKADIANDASFTSFYVFGSNEGAKNNVFNNDEVKGTWTTGDPATATWTAKEAYWQASKTYHFAAYSDGNKSLKNEVVSFVPDQLQLKFTGYTAGENDLVAAITPNVTTDTDVSNEYPVGFEFKHLLSKVQFTMQTTAASTYTVKVTELKFNAIKTAGATCAATAGTFTPTWETTGTDGDYEYDVEAMKNLTTGEQKAVQYVIPQSCQTVEATIGLEISGPGISEDDKVQTVTASMAFSKGEGAGTDNTWQPGFSYNYIAVIEPAKIIDGLKVIEFEVESIDRWTETTDQTPTINKQ